MEIKKIVNICLILAAGVLYLVVSQLLGLAFRFMEWDLSRQYFLNYAEMVAVLAAVLAFFIVTKNEEAMKFLNGAAVELSKVVYPTPKESAQSALIVVVMVGIATGFLALCDGIWRFLVQTILT